MAARPPEPCSALPAPLAHSQRCSQPEFLPVAPGALRYPPFPPPVLLPPLGAIFHLHGNRRRRARPRGGAAGGGAERAGAAAHSPAALGGSRAAPPAPLCGRRTARARVPSLLNPPPHIHWEQNPTPERGNGPVLRPQAQRRAGFQCKECSRDTGWAHTSGKHIRFIPLGFPETFQCQPRLWP